MAHILVIDDEPKMTSLVCGTLEDDGHAVETTTRAADGLALIRKGSYDIVITDLAMPGHSGMDILEAAIQRGGCEVVIMTAHGTVETAVKAMKQGAADYLLKPFSLEELSLLITRLAKRQKEDALSGHYRELAALGKESELIGHSPAIEKVRHMIFQVAPTEATVLLTGRSGTGKELAARSLHRQSLRAAFPFIAVNCAAITETLLESELFGHEKGSFTGAVERKRGRFELAEKGTIFLDEIAEMAPSMQTKLLRVLEERKLVRVGGVDTIEVDVRVIAATNRNLKEEIKTGRFREDLYFRLNVFPIELPSLAERGSDIVLLAKHLLAGMAFRFPDLQAEVQELLLAYDWPGNVRELRNVLERAVILSGGEPLTVAEFALEADDQPLESSARPSGGLESSEREMILAALDKAGGNKTDAARLLKITRRRLYSRMKVHGIQP
jgi:two-component system NtrC family response regulator